jgi:hypothetical protein
MSHAHETMPYGSRGPRCRNRGRYFTLRQSIAVGRGGMKTPCGYAQGKRREGLSPLPLTGAKTPFRNSPPSPVRILQPSAHRVGSVDSSRRAIVEDAAVFRRNHREMAASRDIVHFGLNLHRALFGSCIGHQESHGGLDPSPLVDRAVTSGCWEIYGKRSGGYHCTLLIATGVGVPDNQGTPTLFFASHGARDHFATYAHVRRRSRRCPSRLREGVGRDACRATAFAAVPGRTLCALYRSRVPCHIVAEASAQVRRSGSDVRRAWPERSSPCKIKIQRPTSRST